MDCSPIRRAGPSLRPERSSRVAYDFLAAFAIWLEQHILSSLFSVRATSPRGMEYSIQTARLVGSPGQLARDGDLSCAAFHLEPVDDVGVQCIRRISGDDFEHADAIQLADPRRRRQI